MRQVWFLGREQEGGVQHMELLARQKERQRTQLAPLLPQSLHMLTPQWVHSPCTAKQAPKEVRAQPYAHLGDARLVLMAGISFWCMHPAWVAGVLHG